MVLQYTTPRVKTFSLLSCRKLIGNRNCGDEYNTYIHTINAHMKTLSLMRICHVLNSARCVIVEIFQPYLTRASPLTNVNNF